MEGQERVPKKRILPLVIDSNLLEFLLTPWAPNLNTCVGHDVIVGLFRGQYCCIIDRQVGHNKRIMVICCSCARWNHKRYYKYDQITALSIFSPIMMIPLTLKPSRLFEGELWPRRLLCSCTPREKIVPLDKQERQQFAKTHLP